MQQHKKEIVKADNPAQKMRPMEQTAPREKEIYKVTIVGSSVNFVLSGFKLAAGIFGRSGAMIADAVHSISDFATDIVVLVFVKISSKPKDSTHEFGHGKYETLATVIIGLALFAVAVGIFIDSLERIKTVIGGGIIEKPRLIALLAAFISIVSKEWLYRYTIKSGRKLDSPALVANAWHHRSDAFSSIATLVGIAGATFIGGAWRILDPLAAIVVSLLICRVSYSLSSKSIDELLERSLPEETEAEILKIVSSIEDVRNPHNLRTRHIGTAIAIEIHIRLNAQMTVLRSHEITKELERLLKEHFGQSTHVIIHVEPEK